MARLTGFQTAEANEVQTANASTSIKRGNSPFQHNVQFTISGFSYEKAEMDGKVSKDAYLNPVLTTSVGSLFLSTVLRSRVKADGTVVTPDGTFNKFCREQIAAHNTNGEILQAIVDGCKDKKVVVNRVPYASLTKDGRTVASFLVELNFVEQSNSTDLSKSLNCLLLSIHFPTFTHYENLQSSKLHWSNSWTIH